MNVNEESNVLLCLEFLANWPERQNNMVRRNDILVTPQVINMMYGVPDYRDDEEQLIAEESQGLNLPLFSRVSGFEGYQINDTKIMMRNELNTVVKAWCVFVSH